MTLTEAIGELVDKPTLAAAINVSLKTLRRYERQPDGLPFIKIGKRHMYRPQAVAAWLERRETQRNPRRRSRRGVEHAQA